MESQQSEKIEIEWHYTLHRILFRRKGQQRIYAENQLDHKSEYQKLTSYTWSIYASIYLSIKSLACFPWQYLSFPEQSLSLSSHHYLFPSWKLSFQLGCQNYQYWDLEPCKRITVKIVCDIQYLIQITQLTNIVKHGP